MNIVSSPKRILVLGGYGSFGARLSRLLVQHTPHQVIVAGRRLSMAQKHCDKFAGTPVQLNRRTITSETLQEINVDILVDVTGPFSTREHDPYRLVDACLKAGVHYIDLSDDADFTCGITRFHDAAVRGELLLTSGASTVPAISAAIVKSLTRDIARVEYIETSILPGNRAPRGLSLMQSVLHQAGRPTTVWQDGRETYMPGWSQQRRKQIDAKKVKQLPPRWSALIGAPDVKLFPSLFGAENVCVRAGLELNLMQFGLMALSILPRARLIPTLRPLARPLKVLADMLEPFGSDEGGMLVEVGGQRVDGSLVEKVWSLHAASGEGPFVPVLSAYLLCQRIAEGRFEAGAVTCTELLSEPEIAEALTLIETTTHLRCTERKSLFENTLGEDWAHLPRPIRDVHSVLRRRAFRGVANVTRGTSPLAALICTLMHFPPTMVATPVEVVFEKRNQTEKWCRNFGGVPFTSTVSTNAAGTCEIIERFGPLSFTISLHVKEGELKFPVSKGRLLGIPIPRVLLPQSTAREFVDPAGQFNFQIELSMPLVGRIVKYDGTLAPVMRDATKT